MKARGMKLALVLAALLMLSACTLEPPREGGTTPYSRSQSLESRVVDAIGEVGFQGTVVHQTHLNRVTVRVHVRGLTITEDAVPLIRKKVEKAVEKALPRAQTEVVIELADVPQAAPV